MPNRNVESHFAYNPTNIDINRSTFDMSRSVKTTFNVGRIVPLCPPIEVLPGDTFQIDTSRVVRLQTLLTPMMDNLYMDTYWFFVPNRLVWDHWKQFMGENTESAWIPTTQYSVPQVTSPSGGWHKGTIADYMGVPTNIDNLSVNALPFRGYALIVNEWFRSEVTGAPLVISTGDATQAGSNAGLLSDIAKGGLPYTANKFFDYFTGCLPSPQKGPNVLIPMESSSSNNGWVPVVTFGQSHSSTADYSPDRLLRGIVQDTGGNLAYKGLYKTSDSSTTAVIKDVVVGNANGFMPSNLWANAGMLQASINSLRLAFQIQKLYEKDARGGTRYVEIIKSHFGVTSPDARMQRPEYLGGNRIPLNINQVIQNSSDTANTFLGDLGAMSLSVDNHSDFTKSFTEHGFLHCVGVVRYDHTYQQGLEQLWTRKDRFDFYWPVFANIGEQPVYKREIMATGTSTDADVFGYQEAWASYRYLPNLVTGEMRSNYSRSLDSWHLADDYDSVPTLSRDWMKEDANTVNRVLTVASSVADQVFGDFFFKIKATRPMPVYSIPGLIDHH